MEQQRERLFVTRLHVQHQLDVRPGHSHHTVSNPCSLRKLQLVGVLWGRRYGESKREINTSLSTN